MPVLKYRDPSTGNYVALAVGTSDHGSLAGLTDDDHPQYVKDTGDTMTGVLNIDIDPGGSANPLVIQGPASDGSVISVIAVPANVNGSNQQAGIQFFKHIFGVSRKRWFLSSNSDSETGSNEGSNFLIRRYADDGAVLGDAVIGYRRSGRFDIAGTETFGGIHPVNDTGWRICSNKLQNGWTATNVSLRRVGDMCLMRIANLNASNRTSSNFYTLKTGWVPGSSVFAVVCSAASAGGMARQIISSGATLTVNNSQTSDQTMGGTAIWFTDDEYPTATPES